MYQSHFYLFIALAELKKETSAHFQIVEYYETRCWVLHPLHEKYCIQTPSVILGGGLLSVLCSAPGLQPLISAPNLESR